MIIPVSISDYRELARQKLPLKLFDYIDGAAFDEITERSNREAFASLRLRPLCLRDVSVVDASTHLLGYAQNPMMIAPTSFHQLFDEQGEISSAKAAQACQMPMVVSSMSNKSLEEVAVHSRHQDLWLQIYIFRNRTLTEELVSRAERVGYKALLVTVGTPVSGKRERDMRHRFSLPPQLPLGNFKDGLKIKNIADFMSKELDPSATWEDIRWLQSITKLPLFLKGILNTDDAEKACQFNLAGVVVSNHGGRQLDTAEATIRILPDIEKTVAGRIKILVDSGIRRGSDVFKAIALGADAVLLGRPVLWALAVHGEASLKAMLLMLKEELETVMKLTGCRHFQDIRAFKKHIRCTAGFQ